MKPFAIKGDLKYYSRRPPVSYVTKWVQLYNKYAENNWRGLDDSYLTVEEAEFIPSYYKVTSIINGAKKIRYFYGESAWFSVSDYAGKLGHFIDRK